jgi:hypothetical protein
MNVFLKSRPEPYIVRPVFVSKKSILSYHIIFMTKAQFYYEMT